MKNINTSINEQIPEYVFLAKSGDCVGISNLFVRMSNSVGIPARRIATDGERHSWVEIFSDNKWINFEPKFYDEKIYDNPKFYVNEWREGNGTYHKRLSFVYWLDGEFKVHDITEKYVETGRLVIKITENHRFIDARVILKSHHLMEAIPAEFKVPLTSLYEKTDSNGIFDKNIGPNKYTIIIERDIIPFLPSLFVYKTQREIEVNENNTTEIEITPEANLSLDENFIFGLFSVLFILLILEFIFFRNHKKSKRKSP